MRKLSIEEIMKYSNIASRISDLTDMTSWRDVDYLYGKIKLKLAYVLLIKVLKELDILGKDFISDIPVANINYLIEGYEFEDHFEDFNVSFNELYVNISNTVYLSLGWSIDTIDTYDIISNIACDYGLLIDSDDGYCEDLSFDLIKDSIAEHVDKKTLFICKEELVNALGHAANGDFSITGFYIYKNKKIAKFINLIQANPLWQKSKVITKINEMLEHDISPMQINIHSCRVWGDVYGDEYVFSSMLITTDNDEYVDGTHIQLARVINAIMLDQLIEIAISELPGIQYE